MAANRMLRLLPFSAALLAAGSALGSEAMDLRVMTFNIRFGTARDGPDRWEDRRQAVIDLIRRHRPDALGLQEALRFQIDEIREALPEYGEVGVGRDDGRLEGEYSAILYRVSRFEAAEVGTFWLSDTPERPGSRSWGNRIPRICTWARLVERDGGRGFYLFNLHLDHQSQPSRERAAELLAERLRARARPDPAIVTGDFNAGEDNPAIRYLKGELPRASEGDRPVPSSPGLADSFRVLHSGAGAAGTFNGFKGARTGPKIDYILAPRWARVIEAEILTDSRDGRYPSDHFPVWARLELPAVQGS